MARLEDVVTQKEIDEVEAGFAKVPEEFKAKIGSSIMHNNIFVEAAHEGAISKEGR